MMHLPGYSIRRGRAGFSILSVKTFFLHAKEAALDGCGKIVVRFQRRSCTEWDRLDLALVGSKASEGAR
jgi:hypothetical protein